MLERHHVRACVLVAAAALVPLGCLLTSSFDNVAGVRPIDGSIEPMDAPLGAVVDGQLIDAGSVDAADAADGKETGTVLAFCASQAGKHTLCADFDEGGITSGGFTKSTPNGTMVVLDGTQFQSAPNSMMASTPKALTGTDRVEAILQKTLFRTPASFSLAFDIRLGSCVVTGGALTLFVASPAAGHVYGFLITGSNTFAFTEQHSLDSGLVGPKNTQVLPELVPGAWTKVALNVSYVPDGGTLSVHVDGMEIANKSLVQAIVPDGKVVLNLGANGSGPTEACVVYFDNLVFDVIDADGGADAAGGG